MRNAISSLLGSSNSLNPGARSLLEAIRAAARDGAAARDEVRARLTEREGKAFSEDALGQRLKRLNDALKTTGAAARFVSERGALRFDDGVSRLERDLAEGARKETLREGTRKMTPRAMPATLTVLFSYGWLRDKAQHGAQLDLYRRVEEILAAKAPPEFQALPRFELWRDADRLEHSHGAAAQIRAACDRAFLILAMMSLKYPGSEGCRMEYDAFVDAKGENLPGKMALAVAVNCRRGDLEPRFSAGLRLWLDDDEKTLIECARHAPGRKHAFAVKVAREIRLAARRHLGMADESALAVPADPIEAILSRDPQGLSRGKWVPPMGRRGSLSGLAED